jgi:hypothetical protein
MDKYKYSNKTLLWLLHIWYWHHEYNDRAEICEELRRRGLEATEVYENK